MNFKDQDPALQFVDGFILPTLLLKRRVHFPKKKGRETLSEHLIQLLYFAEFLIEEYSLSLDAYKTWRYILSHDMSEPFTPNAKKSGFDICRFKEPKSVIDNKKKLEEDALTLVRRKFPQLENLACSADAYERQEDDEGRFVKACDALLPMLNIILDNGRTNHIDKVTLGAWRKDKEWKMKSSPPVWKYYEEKILPFLLKNESSFYTKTPVQDELFPKS